MKFFASVIIKGCEKTEEMCEQKGWTEDWFNKWVNESLNNGKLVIIEDWLYKWGNEVFLIKETGKSRGKDFIDIFLDAEVDESEIAFNEEDKKEGVSSK